MDIDGCAGGDPGVRGADVRPATKLFASAIALVSLMGGATALATSTGSGAKPNKLTGYPTYINTIDLSGYQIETSYPLGKLDTGSTYLQKHTGNSVTATASAGPYLGSPAVTYKYIAMPVTHGIVLLVWLEPKFKHNTFVHKPEGPHLLGCHLGPGGRPEPRIGPDRQDGKPPDSVARHCRPPGPRTACAVDQAPARDHGGL
jgi:hypothetical protein